MERAAVGTGSQHVGSSEGLEPLEWVAFDPAAVEAAVAVQDQVGAEWVVEVGLAVELAVFAAEVGHVASVAIVGVVDCDGVFGCVAVVVAAGAEREELWGWWVVVDGKVALFLSGGRPWLEALLRAVLDADGAYASYSTTERVQDIAAETLVTFDAGQKTSGGWGG